MKTIIAALLTVFSVSIFAAQPYKIAGLVTKVSDGDTIHIQESTGEDNRIRLAFVDAPESKQSFGVKSKASLTALALNKQAVAVCRLKDFYGRNVCVVTIDKLELNSTQVQRGLAWVYEEYAPNDSSLYALQTKAKSAKLGLWSEENPTAPWTWRKERRNK